jgi:glycosyltransferase involved in cell wall biosynthesis
MKSKGVFIVTYFSFKDPLIQAYTLPYVKIIRNLIDKKYPVYILTIEKRHQRLTMQERVKVDETLEHENIKLISLEYHRFGMSLLNWIPGLIRILYILTFKNISTVHAWCTTGGAIGLILATLTGKRLVLDSFEPHAEVMAETETWVYQSLQFKILFKFEEWMAKRSDVQICCTESMQVYVRQKFGVKLSNPFTKPACVKLDEFSWGNKKRTELIKELGLINNMVCVYAGKFGGLYLEGEVFSFFKVAYEEIGEQFRVLLLTNDPEERIRKWAKDAGLPDHVIVKRFVPHHLVADYIGLGDFAIAPYRPVPSRNYGAPIKISEYWALGLPVIITSNIADDSYIIDKYQIGSVLKGLNVESYRTSIIEIIKMLKKYSARELYDIIRPFSENFRNFQVAETVYKKVYK